MAAYVFGARLSVKDPEKFSAYQQAAGPTVAKYGGKVIAGAPTLKLPTVSGHP